RALWGGGGVGWGVMEARTPLFSRGARFFLGGESCGRGGQSSGSSTAWRAPVRASRLPRRGVLVALANCWIMMAVSGYRARRCLRSTPARSHAALRLIGRPSNFNWYTAAMTRAGGFESDRGWGPLAWRVLVESARSSRRATRSDESSTIV